MTVGELIRELAHFDQDAIVILSTDGEGNNYEKLATTEKGYCRIGDYEIQLGLEELTDHLKKLGYSDEDVLEDGQPCVVLWPS